MEKRLLVTFNTTEGNGDFKSYHCSFCRSRKSTKLSNFSLMPNITDHQNICAMVTPKDFIYKTEKLEGPCPTVRYVSNYDANAVLGWWYRVGSLSNNTACYKNQGETMYAVQFDNVTINIDICCQNAIDPSNAICGSVVGSGIATPGPQPGTLIYRFRGQIFPIYVLFVDYYTTGVAYGCRKGPHNVREEILFLLSRGYTLNPAKQNEVGKILDSIGIRKSSILYIRQGDEIPQTAGPVPNPDKV